MTHEEGLILRIRSREIDKEESLAVRVVKCGSNVEAVAKNRIVFSGDV